MNPSQWAVALILVLTTLALDVLAIDGYTRGNWNFMQFDMGTKIAPLAAFSPFHIRVTFPTTCASQCGEFQTGGMPVMLFATAFGGQIDAFDYDVVLPGISAHGIIVVAVDRQAGYALTLDYGKLGIQLQSVIGWIRSTAATSGLLYEMNSRGFTNSILNGAARIIMAGHSTGAQIVLRNVRDTALAAQQCPDAGGFVMWSPVDGQDALGLGGDTVITGNENLPFQTPGLIIGAQLDGTDSSIIEGVACAPDARSNLHFYYPWVGWVQFLQVQGVGHLDILDEAATTPFDEYCARSNASQVALRVAYRTMVRGATVNFIQGVVLNNNDYITQINSIPPNGVTLLENLQKGTGTGYTCTYVPVATGLSFEVQTGLVLFGIFFALTFITGLYCFFRKMDDDTLHRYHPAEGVGYDQPASFQTKLEPQYVSSEYPNPNPSFNLGTYHPPSLPGSRNSINV